MTTQTDLEAVQAHCNDVTTELHRQLDAMRAERDQMRANRDALFELAEVSDKERVASRANEARLREAVVRIGIKPDPYFEWIHAPHMVRVDDVAFAREALAATDSRKWLREKLMRVAQDVDAERHRREDVADSYLGDIDLDAIVDAELAR